MKEGRGSYVPPAYIPLGGLEQSDSEAEKDEDEVVVGPTQTVKPQNRSRGVPYQWSSGICACCDDLQSYGVLLGLPGCFVSCYACGYRRTLRSKYNLQEAPCGDSVTHFFCHLCAICQEYREIRERSGGSNSPDLHLVEVTAPPHQAMESATSN